MPYKFKNGKFIIDPNAKTALNPRYLKTFNGNEHNLLTITDKGLADLDLLNVVPQKKQQALTIYLNWQQVMDIMVLNFKTYTMALIL